MDIIDKLTSSVNHCTTAAIHTINKVATNPSATKKLIQIGGNLIAAFNLYQGTNHLSELSRSLSGTVNIIDLYGTFKCGVYWINPFSKETIDQEVLKTSLCGCIHIYGHLQFDSIEEEEDFIQKIVDEVMSTQNLHSKGDVKRAIKASLKDEEIDDLDNLVNHVIVKQKSRPILQLLGMGFTTAAAIGGSLLTLDKLGVINLARFAGVAAQLGKEFPVFLFILNLGAGTVLGVIGCTANALLFAEATHRAIHHFRKGHREGATEEEIAQANKELRTAVIDMVANGADFVSGALPLLLPLNPPAIIGLALFAKGIGIVCILIR